MTSGRSWWARLACIDFAQPLLFYGLPMLCERADRAVATEKFALKLMRDPRLEVRDIFLYLISGCAHLYTSRRPAVILRYKSKYFVSFILIPEGINTCVYFMVSHSSTITVN